MLVIQYDLFGEAMYDEYIAMTLEALTGKFEVLGHF